MPTFLLILGLTIIYYLVLFRLDKHKKAAFQKAAQQAIGPTEVPPFKNPSPDVFGPLNKAGKMNPLIDNESITKTIKAEAAANLKADLEEMLQEVQIEQTLETSNNNLMTQLAANTKVNLDEKQLSKMVTKISNRKS